MQRLPAVNPTDTGKYPYGIGTFDVGAANEGSKILFYNQSPNNLQLDFLNGSTDTLYAWEANYWVLDADTKQIEWVIDPNSLAVKSPPISIVFMTLWDAQEKIPGTYPINLSYQTNIGNLGGIQTTTTQQVINDANTLQQVVEATLSGHSSSDVIINNDGSFTLKGAGLLAVAGVLTHIFGTLTVDQAVTLAAALAVSGASTFAAATFSGEITANSDLKTNTVRDNNTGAQVLNFGVPTTVNGTSGAFTTYFVVWGPYCKILHIGFASYINNVAKTVNFPSSFARGGFHCGSLGDAANTIQPKLGGSLIQVEVIKQLATGTAGGLTDSTTSIFRFAHGNIISTIDNVVIGATASAANGEFILIGA